MARRDVRPLWATIIFLVSLLGHAAGDSALARHLCTYPPASTGWSRLHGSVPQHVGITSRHAQDGDVSTISTSDFAACGSAMSVPKVALLFMSVGTMPMERVWARWFDQACCYVCIRRHPLTRHVSTGCRDPPKRPGHRLVRVRHTHLGPGAAAHQASARISH